MTSEKWRVLVVEDQPLVAETIEAALGDDHDVVCAGKASDALNLLRAGRFDLVLLDCLLPGGRAGDVVDYADLTRVPVVLMSGDIDQIEMPRGDFHPFLAKPFSIDVLLRTASAALPERRLCQNG